MIEPKENEPRIVYLMRVLELFMRETEAGGCTIDYDGTTCDGFCLFEDIRNEIEALPEFEQ